MNLERLKREHFELAEKGEKNCLGLIQIALISGHKIEIKKQTTETKSYFLFFLLNYLKNSNNFAVNGKFRNKSKIGISF